MKNKKNHDGRKKKKPQTKNAKEKKNNILVGFG